MRETYSFLKNLQQKNSEWEIDLQLRPDEYAAIGRVSAQWGFLDFHISRLCVLIAEGMEEPINKDFEADSFRKRKRAWLDLIQKALPSDAPERHSMEQIIKKAGELQGERQIAIHSFFEWDKKDKNRIKGHSHKNPNNNPRTFTVSSIENIATKIAKLNAQLLMWPDMNPTPSGSFSLRDTLATHSKD